MAISNLQTDIANINNILTNMNYKLDVIANDSTHRPYKKLEYIQSSGTQYIDTQYVPNSNTKIQLGMSNDVSNDTGLLGACSIWTTNTFLFYDWNGIRWCYTNEVALADSSAKLAYHDIELYRASCKIDGTVVSSDTTNNNTNINTNLFIFRGGGRCSSFRLHYLKVFENNSLIFDFIPTKRIEDEVVCLYDTISKQFFLNSGTGTFIAGTEIG